MHIPTHIFSGWCTGNLFRLTARERLFCMVAATIADIDGIGIIFGEQTYWNYHHKLGHNLFFGLLSSAILTAFSLHRFRSFFIYLALFHLHLIMDYFGSGPLWSIYYLWPTKYAVVRNPNAWEFSSWQNVVVASLLLIWTIIIAVRNRRTPLELLTPRLDQKIVNAISKNAT